MSTQYLLLQAAGNELLLELAQVVQVIAAGDLAACRDGHATWQGETLPLHDYRALLAGTPDGNAAAVLVVARAGDERRLLVVDAAAGIVSAAAEDFAAFAPVSRATAAHFDRALRRAGNACALRLRWPPPAGIVPA